MTLLPLFTSDRSIPSSLLTLEEPGKAKDGNPQSIFDLAVSEKMTEVVLCEDRISGFFNAYRSALKAKVKLCYGLKLVVCSDLTDKSPQSRASESKLVVFLKDTAGHPDLVRLWSKAWTDGHFSYRRPGATGGEVAYGRLDWAELRRLWSPNLIAALPFFSSFLAVNTMTFNKVVPDLSFLPPGAPLWLFKEVDSRLPFAHLLEGAVDRYAESAASGQAKVHVQSVKSIYYADRSDIKEYTVRRAIANRSSYEAPEVPHLASSEFCWQAYLHLTKGVAVA